MCIRLFSLLLLPVVLCACPRPPPSAQDGADYFRIDSAFDPRYERSTGLEEEHDYTANADAPEGTLRFDRVARASGFIEDDRTMTFEFDGESLKIVSFLDCLNSCERLDTPEVLLPWPLEGREVQTFDTTVTVVENSVEVGTQEETHRVAVGNEEETSTPAGTFTGFDVLWTRTIDDAASRTARLFVVPDVGFVKIEGWDGATMELLEAPPPLAE